MRSLNARRGCFSAVDVVAINYAEGIAGTHFVANFYFADESHSWINLVFDSDATAASFCNCIANLSRINLRHKSGARRFYRKRFICQRQNALRVIDNTRVAGLRLDVSPKHFQSRARFVNTPDAPAREIDRALK